MEKGNWHSQICRVPEKRVVDFVYLRTSILVVTASALALSVTVDAASVMRAPMKAVSYVALTWLAAISSCAMGSSALSFVTVLFRYWRKVACKFNTWPRNPFWHEHGLSASAML